MINIIKNIFSNKNRDKKAPEIDVPEIIVSEHETIINTPKITKLTEEELRGFIDKEIEKGKQQLYVSYYGLTTVDTGIDELDPMFREAAEAIVVAQQGSASLLQRKLNLGYNHTGRIIDQLEAIGVIGPFEGSKARQVLIPTIDALYKLLEEKKYLTSSDEELKYKLFKEEYLSLWQDYIQSKINKYHSQVMAEMEREAIKQEFLEKERRRKLRKEVHRELIEGGIIENYKINDRRISQEVKDLVWNRDNGKCVQCGSNEKLEFDHIIPISKGGSNTYRNIQILCESCNREKSNKIG